MACTDCNNTVPMTFSVQSFLTSTCGNCGDSSCEPAKGVCYTGPDLVCSGILKNDNLEDALTKIDTKLCSVAGDYTVYQMNCLPTWFGSPIEDEATFVDAITSYICELTESLEEFTGTEFTAFQTDVDERLDAIEVPGFTCASAGIISTDNLNTILTKFCTKYGEIDDALDTTDLDFSTCFTVVTPPETVKESLVLLSGQICEVKTIAENATGAALPVFNNVGSCLAGPLTTTDTLVSTVNKLKDKVCTLPTYSADNLTWGCVGAPVSDTDLEEGLELILDAVNTLLPKQVTFGDGFTVEPTNVGNPCEGVTVSIEGGADKWVAATNSDVTPGTLEDKLVGVGIDIDTLLNADKITLVSQYKVKAATADDAPNFLIDKLNGSTSNGITITPTYNVATKKIDLILTVDSSALCALVGNCAGVYPCAGYLVTPTTTSSLSYTDCNGTVVNITSISGPTTICATLGTVYAPGATIVNTGSCGGGCSAPANLTVSAITISSFVETWDAVVGATEYEYRVDGGSWISVGTDLTVTINSLLPDSIHTFEVRAIIGDLECAETASNEVNTLEHNYELDANYGMNITTVAGTGIPSLGSTGLNGELTGIHTGVSGTVSVSMTGTPGDTIHLTAYVDGVAVDCVDVTTAGTYDLEVTASEAEVLRIVLELGACVEA